MEKYVCKECGAEATVKENGEIIRTCDHVTTIVLELMIVVTGESILS